MTLLKPKPRGKKSGEGRILIFSADDF